jgi:DNA-binding MarR family transcriptional regulator
MFQLARRMKEEMSFANNLMQLSALQIQTLIFLDQHKNGTMSEIAKYFRIELPSATSLINKLYNKKLVDRCADPTDRRIVRMSLTTTGKSLLEEAMNQRKDKLKKILAYLSKQEKADLFTILTTLKTRLQK